MDTIPTKKCKCGGSPMIKFDCICKTPFVLVVCEKCGNSCEGVTFFKKEERQDAVEKAVNRWNNMN